MILVITQAGHLPGETECWKELIAAGADAILLRKPGWTEDDYAHLLEEADPVVYPQLLIAQHYQLQQRYGLRGVHFSESLRNSTLPQQLEALRNEECLLSTGIHYGNTPTGMQTVWDLLLLSPVFDSISKPGYKGLADQGFHRNNEPWAAGNSPSRLIALGGIHQHNAALAKQMGFDGIALLGAVWQKAGNAVEHFIEIKKAWNGIAHT
ncbi:thiamine phosphate synthase [uncultured Chitinophaga sp.]|uniref:thiamine phosphate synthase n=1 Tax=uncultured Chitinophaga sp. TaxID=339340 RepID=UPI002628662A|nr:thiamine phosphate synthase [uncultured Chitinophaga sp.]